VALERAAGDAAMEILEVIAARLSRDDEHVLLLGHRQFVWEKPATAMTTR
jgi:hypothetical protein